METLMGNIGQVVGITVIHSLWQGLLIYLLLRLVLGAMPKASSARRYALSFGALSVMTIWFTVTLVTEVSRISWVVPDTQALAGTITYLPAHMDIPVNTAQVYQHTINQYLPYVAAMYLFGLLFNVMRLCFAWRSMLQVRRSTREAAAEFAGMMQRMAGQLGIRRPIAIRFSHLVDVPGVIGYLKPVVLLPISMASNLSMAEAEAIILHELAHIRYNHYLHNVLQQVMQVLLFFNPFSLFINRAIHAERENCCDDAVVAITGEPLTYARALLKLEQQKQHDLQLALAATGKKFALLNRIERIMTTKTITINIRHTLAAIVLFALSLGSIAWFNPDVKNKINKAVKGSHMQALLSDTVPAKRIPPPPKPPKVVKSKKIATAPVPPPPAPPKTKTYLNAFNMKFGKDFDIDDPEFKRLLKEVEKHGNAVSAHYSNADFKRLNEELSKSAASVDAFYNKPELKALLDRQNKIAADFDKNFSNNPQMESLSKQMDKLGEGIDKYFNSPEFKTLSDQLDKEVQKLQGLDSGTVAYNQERKKLNELSHKMGALASAPAIKQQQQQMKALSKQMHDYYQGDAYKKQQQALRAISDSIRTAFSDVKVKQHEEQMRQLTAKLREFDNSSDLKKEQQALKEASEKLRVYMQSDAFKNNLEAAKKRYKQSFTEHSDTAHSEE